VDILGNSRQQTRSEDLETMKEIRRLEKSRLILFLLPLILATVITPATAAGPSYLPGVKKGDQWTYGDWQLSCSDFCPSSFVGQLVGINSFQIQVQNVTGTYNVGAKLTFTFYNGSSTSSTAITNTLSSSGFTFLIAGGLTKGDHTYNSTFAPTINETVTRFYAGANRQVNILDYTQQFPGFGNFTIAIYYDQATGAALEIYERVSVPTSSGQNGGTLVIHARVTTTNLWTSTLPDFSLSSTPLSPATVNVGGSSSSIISLTSLQGLPGPIQISTVISPPITNRPTATANPPSVVLSQGKGTATLSVTTTTSTVPGNYTVLVIANYTTTVSHYLTLDISVTGPDFTIAVYPSSFLIPAGSSQTAQVVLTSLKGFTGPVNLSPTVTPPGGPTTNLAPNPVTIPANGKVNSTLTITVPQTVSTTYFNGQINAVSGSLSHSTYFTVYVTGFQPPDFQIIPLTPGVQLDQGSSTAVTVLVTSLNGFSGTVTLSAQSPTGLKAFLNMTSVNLPANGSKDVTLTLQASTTGFYTVTITGISGSTTRYAYISVTVTPPKSKDFTVTAQPRIVGILSTPVGNSGISTITVASQGGFSGTIHVTINYDTAHLTLSPATKDVTLSGPGSSQSFNVTITTTSTTGQGLYDIPVSASNGTVSHTFRMTANVAPLPSITSVSAITTDLSGTIVIQGSGFGNTPPQTTSLGDGSIDTIENDTTPSLAIWDNCYYQDCTGGIWSWQSGHNAPKTQYGLNFIGIYLTSWSDTKIVLGGFGTSNLAPGTRTGGNCSGPKTWAICVGDTMTVGVWGPYNIGKVLSKVTVTQSTATTPPTITSVTGVTTNTHSIITIQGTGFGNTPPATVALSDGSVDTVESSTTPSIAIGDNCPSLGCAVGGTWEAGHKLQANENAIGIYLTSWSDTKIVINRFGNYLTEGTRDTSGKCAVPSGWGICLGDPITIEVWGPNNSGVASYTVTAAQGTKTNTSISESCSTNSIEVGTFTTCTATATGDTPSGDVTFSTTSSSGTFTPTSAKCTLHTGACSVTYGDTAASSLTATITASYAGDAYNTAVSTNFVLNVMKPASTTATATSSLTVTSGQATADQTSVTGISVTITGSGAGNGTPVAISTRDISSLSTGVGTVSLANAQYYDVLVAGINDGNAKVCIDYASASSSTTMQYWNGATWTSASNVNVNGATICGQIPVSALKGTNIAVGTPIQSVSPGPLGNSNLLLIIAGAIVAIAVVGVVAMIFLRRRGRATLSAQPSTG
jgi:hypothetical protein